MPSENKRIAKNTLLLYFRTILIMMISLYTSRVVLNVLGVSDYGIYNVVGGVVGMFSVISGALSNSISRFITYSLGKGKIDELHKVFSTSVIVQIIIAFLVFVLCEIVGVWFLHNKLVIPFDRLTAAQWVLQCSLLSFVINLISVPYNASIIAHEKMNAFAYICIFEALLKLLIVYLLLLSEYDKLITYSILMVLLSLTIRFIYGYYCKLHFIECRGKLVCDKSIFKSMLSFAGWNFFSNAVYVFNNQGINMLVNVYFGVTLNAARGIATQVENSVMQFVNNFTTAINPQITKSYAAKDYERLYYLICKGAKFSFFLILIVMLPILFETEFILQIWLKNVPNYAVLFTRLAFLTGMVGILGNSCYTACLATGKIRNYTLWVSVISSLVFFFTWLAYYMGFSAEYSYYMYIIDWVILLFVKLFLTKSLVNFNPNRYIHEVLFKIIPISILCVIPPTIIRIFFETSYIRLIINLFVCLVSSSLLIYYLGLTIGERYTIMRKIKKYMKRIISFNFFKSL